MEVALLMASFFSLKLKLMLRDDREEAEVFAVRIEKCKIHF